MSTKTVIDWLTIEEDYITSELTYKELSNKHNVNYNTLKMRACKNKWGTKRDEHKRKVIDKVYDKLAEVKANQIINITNNVLDALLAATREIKEYEEVNGRGELVKHSLDNVQIKKVESIVRSITQIQRVELEKQRVDLEKLKIEQGESAEDKLTELLSAVKSIAYDESEEDLNDE